MTLPETPHESAAAPFVLVVDDEDGVREATRRALNLVGFRCDGAANGQDALDLIGKKDYEVVITDLRMPVMHGHALITKLLELPSPPLIVVLTAVSEPKIVLDLHMRGVPEVAIKPVDYDVFSAKIKTLHQLRGRGARPSRESLALKASQEISQVTEELQTRFKVIQEDFERTITSLRLAEQELEDSFLGSLRMIAGLNEQKGEEEDSHSGRVEAIVGRIAPHFGFEGIQIRAIKVASLLHEIGQFGLPDRVRTRHPWTLAESELPIYRRYPSIGAMLLSQVPGSERVTEWVECHQERFDGKGFPGGMRGNEIPLGARIIHIADGMDLFRMYYSGEDDPQGLVLTHIEEERGKSYDPKLVDFILSHKEEVFPASKERQIFVVTADELQTRQVLAEDLFDNSGLLLIRRGAVVSESMLPRLRVALGKRTIKVSHH